MDQPSVKTIKRLFAECGNRCAFPKCSKPMVDPGTGTIVGEICHIKGKRPGGPRYDASQTEVKRHGYDNLFLLCGPHHKIVDDDPIAYTVERLRNMKREHLEHVAHAGGPTIDDQSARKLIENMNVTVIEGGLTQENSPNAQQQQALDVHGHVIQAGRDVNIGVPVAPTTPLPWLHRSGCPQFDMRRGIQPVQGKIGGDMRISGADPWPISIEVKWEWVGIDMDWTRPTPTGVYRNEQLAFHMGWVTLPSKPDKTEIRFRVRFWWNDEQHGATWIWYLVPHASKQGIWEWDHHIGSATGQPNIGDTW